MNRPSFVEMHVYDTTERTLELQLLARELLMEREKRNWFVPHALFDEVAWDIMLDLYASSSPACLRTLVEGRHSSVATVDRWMDFLSREGFIRRSTLQFERIELTRKAHRSLTFYLADINQRRRQRYEYGCTPDRSLSQLSAAMALSAIAGSLLTFMALTLPVLALWIGGGAAFLTVAALLFCRWILDEVPESTGLP